MGQMGSFITSGKVAGAASVLQVGFDLFNAYQAGKAAELNEKNARTEAKALTAARVSAQASLIDDAAFALSQSLALQALPGQTRSGVTPDVQRLLKKVNDTENADAASIAYDAANLLARAHGASAQIFSNVTNTALRNTGNAATSAVALGG